MRLRLTLLLYNLLLPVVMLVLLPANIIKMRRRGGYKGRFRERFGCYLPDVRERLRAGQGRAWWIHAVSVGEVNVAQKLIAEIRRVEPDRPLVLSVTTSTGRAVAEQIAATGLTVIYSPLDFGWVVRAVLSRIRPERYILMESEIWPNLVRRAGLRNIPVVLANARLSPRSERRYLKVRSVAAPLFSMLHRVLVQEDADVARWAGVGVPRERIRVTGSIKYDLAGGANAARAEEFRMLLECLHPAPLPPVVLAASTHAGEEKLIGEAIVSLRTEFPDLLFLAAPRHAERRAEVCADLVSAGLHPVLRSTLPGSTPGADVLIVDSTGELRDWQALASVVVIGKSLLAEGGQNPAEAIAAGVPVITGPHMQNFLPLMDLLCAANGITRLESPDALVPALRTILRDPDGAATQARRGRAALEQHRGAAARTVEAIKGV